MDKPSSNLFKFWFMFLALVVLGAGIYHGTVYFKNRDKINGLKNLNAYIESLKNDTYGGKTPEETLKLFLSALKEGDVEKASLYFTLDDTGSRQKWLDHLTSVKEKGLLPTMVSDIETLAKPIGPTLGNNFLYQILNPDETAAVTIELVLVGDIWKMERY